MAHFTRQVINGLTLGAIYGLIATGPAMMDPVSGIACRPLRGSPRPAPPITALGPSVLFRNHGSAVP